MPSIALTRPEEWPPLVTELGLRGICPPAVAVAVGPASVLFAALLARAAASAAKPGLQRRVCGTYNTVDDSDRLDRIA